MNRFGLDESKWQAAKAEAKTILIERARRGDPIAYSELVKGIHTFSLEPHDIRLFDLIGEISTEESAAGRGMLSALVVTIGENKPGAGFFELAKQLGYDVKDQDTFWDAEVKRVCAAWRK